MSLFLLGVALGGVLGWALRDLYGVRARGEQHMGPAREMGRVGVKALTLTDEEARFLDRRAADIRRVVNTPPPVASTPTVAQTAQLGRVQFNNVEPMGSKRKRRRR